MQTRSKTHCRDKESINPMKPKKQGRRSAEDAEKTKQTILNVATQLFSEQGFTRVSIRHISEQAGISHSLIRHHFGSKEQIWHMICDTLKNQMETYCTEVIHRLPPDLPINEKLYQFSVKVLAFHLLHPQTIKLAADMMSQEEDQFIQLLNESSELGHIVNNLTTEYCHFYPTSPLTTQELKWDIIMFAHSAASFRPYLDSIWKSSDRSAGLLHHWKIFNLLMATKLSISQERQLTSDNLFFLVNESDEKGNGIQR